MQLNEFDQFPEIPNIISMEKRGKIVVNVWRRYVEHSPHVINEILLKDMTSEKYDISRLIKDQDQQEKCKAVIGKNFYAF